MITTINEMKKFLNKNSSKGMNENNTNIPMEIFKQLGGNKFKAMVSATMYADGENTLVVKFKGSKVANIMYITLDSDDTYTVKICKYRNLDIKVIKEISGVYNDMLKSIFEETTGLRTSL